MQKENYDIWLEGFERVSYPRAILPTNNEIVIIGGGITGITATYLLSKNGINPILLEKRKLGEYVTDCTTGFLSEIIDIPPQKIIDKFGIEKAKLIVESHKNAIDEIEKIIDIEKIKCEFLRCSNYIYANNIDEEKILLKEIEIYKKIGIDAEYKKDTRLKFNDFGYIEIFNQAKFNVIKYLTSLAQISVKNGALIAEDTNVLSISGKTDKIEIDVENVGTINAKRVFSATYIPFAKPKKLEHKYNMYRSYVLEYKIPKNILVEGTYQDSLKPYHYFRIDKQNNYDRLIIGGNDTLEILKIDHEIGTKIIRDYTIKFFANIKYEEIRHWSGLISEPIDGLAYIGESEEKNIFYAFGFSGNGLTYSYISSKIFADQFTNQKNGYSDIYKIKRKISWWEKFF